MILRALKTYYYEVLNEGGLRRTTTRLDIPSALELLRHTTMIPYACKDILLLLRVDLKAVKHPAFVLCGWFLILRPEVSVMSPPTNGLESGLPSSQPHSTRTIFSLAGILLRKDSCTDCTLDRGLNTQRWRAYW
jgi:hypothetical protein